MGISALIGSVVSAIGTVGTAVAGGATALAEGIGIPAAIAGPIGAGVTDALGGAALGAGEAAITGGNIAKGAEFGAITGGIGGAGGAALQGFGVPATAADAIAGAGSGALGALATGGNVGQGALIGGIGGAAAGASGIGARAGGAGPGAAAAGPIGVSPTDTTPTLSGPDAVPGNAPITSQGAPVSGIDTSVGQLSSVSAPSNLETALPSSIGGASSGTLQGSTVGAGAAAPGVPTASGITVSPQGGSATLATPANPITSQGNPPPVPIAENINPNGGQAINNPALNPAPLSAPLSMTGSIGGPSLFSNPKADIAMAGLAMDALKGSSLGPAATTLGGIASRENAQAAQLMGYVQSGALPPGMQLGLNAAAESEKAAIRAAYAARGMQGSSAEAQDLQAVGAREAAQGAQIANQLFQSGLNEANQADQIYLQLMNQQIQQDQQLGQSIGNLAAAMASMASPVTPGGATAAAGS